MGDLNCRLEGISKADAIKSIEKNELDKLLKLDQVSSFLLEKKTYRYLKTTSIVRSSLYQDENF